jgi:hypothetical protein
VVAAAGPLSRRALLGSGAVAALAAAGCGNRERPRPAGGDAGVLAGLLAVERELVEAWDAVAAIDAPERALVVAVLAHERAHAARLAVELQRAGNARVPAAAAPVRRAADAVRARAAAGDVTGALDAAVGLERAAGAVHVAALGQLSHPDRRVLAMALSASEAQHASVALAALGRDPIPDPFGGTA